MMQLCIEQISDSEVDTVAALATEIWHEFFPKILTAGQIDYMVEKFQSAPAMREQLRGGYRYYAVRRGGELIGYIGVQPQEERLFLSKIYLRKDCRGHGYGRQMLDFVVALARELGETAVYLTVNRFNDSSIAVYLRTGFTVIDQTVTDIGHGYVMDDFIMQLSV